MSDHDDGLKVQVYKDLAAPAVKEAGEVVGRAVRLALAPVRGALWTMEQAEQYVTEQLQKLITSEEADVLQSPPARILGPVLAGVAQVGDEQLRRLYTQLLATSMRPEKEVAHPAFAEVIRQLTPSEARILNLVSTSRKIPTLQVLTKRVGRPSGVWVRHVTVIGLQAGVDDPARTDLYLENLVRLRLLGEIEPLSQWDDESYDLIYQLSDLQRLKQYAHKQAAEIEIRKTGFLFTDFGKRFADACLPKAIFIPRDVTNKLEERVVGFIDQLEYQYGKL